MINCAVRVLKSFLIKKPIFCIFRVTSRCNLTCRMCSVWRHGDKAHELSLEKIEELGKILKKLNISIVNLGGGEPFLREDLVEIVKILSKNFNVRMQTNAILATEEKIKKLVKAGLKGVSISLDTLSPVKQDYICNSKGTWYKTIEKMVFFSRLMPRRGSLLLSNAVVSKLNIEELPKLAIFANKMGYSAVFLPVLLSEKENHNYTFRDYAPKLGFRKDDYPLIERIYAELIEMKKKGHDITSSIPFLKDSVLFFKGNHRWRCDAGSLYFHVDSDGSFIPCTELKRSGSFFEKDFVNKFFSREFRNAIMEKVARCPGCMQPCQAEITKTVHDPEVLAEKSIAVLRFSLRKRNFLEYEEAIKYANLESGA